MSEGSPEYKKRVNNTGLVLVLESIDVLSSVLQEHIFHRTRMPRYTGTSHHKGPNMATIFINSMFFSCSYRSQLLRI